MDAHGDERSTAGTPEGATGNGQRPAGDDREALGAAFTRRWGLAMLAVLTVATLLLVVLVLLAR